MSILVVMADDLEARLAAYLLTQVDSNVAVAHTVAETEHHLAQRTWKALVLDTMFADGRGVDVVAHLRQMAFDTAVVMLSADKETAVKVQALEAGADDYIVLPYEPAELLARMRAVLRRVADRRGRHDSAMIRAGALEMDVNALEVGIAQQRRVRVTPNEARLLRALMSHVDEVVPQHELASLLLGSDVSLSVSNAVSVYIRRLRRKIETDPEHPRYIVTARGHGYRLNSRALTCPRGVDSFDENVKPPL